MVAFWKIEDVILASFPMKKQNQPAARHPPDQESQTQEDWIQQFSDRYLTGKERV